MTMRINITKIFRDVQLPSYAHEGDAGADIYAHLTGDPISSPIAKILPNQTALIPTGFRMELPNGYEAQIRSRSGMAKRGLIVANSPGTIDSGYRGEVGVLILNTSDRVRFIDHGDRIAQMVVAPVTKAEFTEVGGLTDTDRGSGGFGSTGT